MFYAAYTLTILYHIHAPKTTKKSLKIKKTEHKSTAFFIQFNNHLGVDCMKQSVANRATILGEYIKKNGATVRSTAGVFNISKSTVHKDVTERLKNKNPILYNDVKKVLELNKKERHIRGGLATRKKYKGE